jgi:hypothetical protein
MKFDRSNIFAGLRRLHNAARGTAKLSQSQVGGVTSLFDFIEADTRWADNRHVAYFFGTVAHETAWTFQPIKEYRARAGSAGRANQDRYWLTGYYGRGYCQLTWLGNYRKAMWMLKEVGIDADLVGNPDLALDPKVAYWIAAEGMRRGLFTGKKLSDYIGGSRCDYINARKVINGLDRAEQIARYAAGFEALLNSSVEEAKQA